jgi:hypothetical protein
MSREGSSAEMNVDERRAGLSVGMYGMRSCVFSSACDFYDPAKNTNCYAYNDAGRDCYHAKTGRIKR